LETEFNRSVLDNGIRVLSETVPSVRSVSIGAWVDVGSRDEPKDINGISHFIEHMVFKGTTNRTALEIAESLESVGGNLNAFTSREQTCFYAKILDEHLPKAVDVISDLLLNPLFKEDDIEKEKKVVIEEIQDVQDNPSDLIHDIFAKTIWGSNPIANPIMGNKETVNALTRQKLFNYMAKHYFPKRTIVAASGNLEHKKLLELVETKFEYKGDVDGVNSDRISPNVSSRINRQEKDIGQVHISLGFPTIEFKDKRRIALLILNTILGGGMSSRLFQTVREKEGLVYTIYSFLDFFTREGLIGFYFATSTGQVAKTLELVYKVFNEIKGDSISEQELYYAKSQLKGNLVLGLENTSNRMNRIARHEILLGRFISIDETIASIDKAGRDEIIDIANYVLDPNRMNLASLGPADESELIPFH